MVEKLNNFNSKIYEDWGLTAPRPEGVRTEDQAPLRDGYSKHYRGNHRSDNRGLGFKAFMRNKWMKPYN